MWGGALANAIVGGRRVRRDVDSFRCNQGCNIFIHCRRLGVTGSSADGKR
jgi:hypothetical protein